jgi:hypothetical protein
MGLQFGIVEALEFVKIMFEFNLTIINFIKIKLIL